MTSHPEFPMLDPREDQVLGAYGVGYAQAMCDVNEQPYPWLPEEEPAATVRSVPLDDDTARELSRAAKQAVSWTERRNQLIKDAIDAGHGVREVARAVGLNHATVLNIIKPKKRGTT